MRSIDMQSWPRRKHFEVYNAFDYPHINLCANVDITAFHPFVKQHALSLNTTLVYLFSRVANAIPEFRYRIRERQVVEHEVVHPSTTILTEGDLFSFCTIPYIEDYATFAAQAERIIAHVKEQPRLDDEPGQDDLLFMTGIPWVSFTSLQHPIHMHPGRFGAAYFLGQVLRGRRRFETAAVRASPSRAAGWRSPRALLHAGAGLSRSAGTAAGKWAGMTDDFNSRVQRQIDRLQHCSYQAIEAEVAQKRIGHGSGQPDRITPHPDRPTPRQAFDLLFFDYMGLSPDELPIVSETETEIVWHSVNPCPTLEAVKALGLDTRTVCRAAYEKSTQAFVSQPRSAIEVSAQLRRDSALRRSLPRDDRARGF